jgi:hypothetical protein
MDSASGKRYTRIDFGKLGLDSRRKTGALIEATEEVARDEDTFNDSVRQKDVAAKILTRKRSLPMETGGKEDAASLKPLRLPQIIQSGIRAHLHLETTHGSPWETYEKSHDVRLGVNGYVTVAERREARSNAFTRNGPLSNLVLVKEFVGVNVEGKLRKFQQIQHANVLSPLEVFRFEGIYHVVFEYMAYSLYYVAGNPRLDDVRLAAILGQVRYLQIE